MRTKNEKNVYKLTCKVTGVTVATNPKQFNDTVARYGVTDEVLNGSYVSRDGRNILRSRGLTAAQAVAEFGIDPAVAANIKNLAKEAVVAAPVANIEVEVPASAVLPAVTPSTEVTENVPVETGVVVAA